MEEAAAAAAGVEEVPAGVEVEEDHEEDDEEEDNDGAEHDPSAEGVTGAGGGGVAPGEVAAGGVSKVAHRCDLQKSAPKCYLADSLLLRAKQIRMRWSGRRAVKKKI